MATRWGHYWTRMQIWKKTIQLSLFSNTHEFIDNLIFPVLSQMIYNECIIYSIPWVFLLHLWSLLWTSECCCCIMFVKLFIYIVSSWARFIIHTLSYEALGRGWRWNSFTLGESMCLVSVVCICVCVCLCVWMQGRTGLYSGLCAQYVSVGNSIMQVSQNLQSREHWSKTQSVQPSSLQASKHRV